MRKHTALNINDYNHDQWCARVLRRCAHLCVDASLLWHEMITLICMFANAYGPRFGFMYYSTDGGSTWHGTDTKAYENVVQLVGGGSKILSRRERPHVVMGRIDDGPIGPIGLTNGVTEAWPCTLQREPDRPPCKYPPTPGTNPDCGPGSNGTSIWCPVDYCYTLFQPFVLKL